MNICKSQRDEQDYGQFQPSVFSFSPSFASLLFLFSNKMNPYLPHEWKLFYCSRMSLGSHCSQQWLIKVSSVLIICFPTPPPKKPVGSKISYVILSVCSTHQSHIYQASSICQIHIICLSLFSVLGCNREDRQSHCPHKAYILWESGVTDDNRIHKQTHVIITKQTTKLCSETGCALCGY